MSVQISKSGNFIIDMRKSQNEGKSPLIFACLFDSKYDFKVTESACNANDLKLSGVLLDKQLLSLRHPTMHEQILSVSQNAGLPVYSLEQMNIHFAEYMPIVIVVKSKYEFFGKIIQFLNKSGLDCKVYHISEVKHNSAKVNKQNGLLPIHSDCSGCGACFKACPSNAITMEYNNDGFLMPNISNQKCIKCGLCSKVCPSVNAVFRNSPEPKCYSFCASDDIRKLSSSGGVFSVLAEYTIRQGGVVCGAAFNEKMELKHTIVSRSDQLEGLRGSKYLQSDASCCFNEIRDLLNNNKMVMFVGTPCQVAGLNSFLRRDYPNLLTVDLLCHGTPSPKFFDQYMKDISQEKKIINVEFRSKKLGWSFSGVVITYDDGTSVTSKIKDHSPNPYLKAFIDNMMMRDMCYDCRFNNFPRQGDFSIGDLWHSDILDPLSNDKKGTSIVFLNNKKAEIIFLSVSDSAKYCKELKIKQYAKIPNRVLPKAVISPYRERFLELLKTKTFTQAYDDTLNDHFDIGMPSVLLNENIGSILTYYALYNVLSELGYSVLPIERPLDSPLPCSEKAVEFCKKWLPSYAQPRQYMNLLAMRVLNKACSQFVLGSDQVFLYSMSQKRNHFFFLQWANENKKRISYASSYGGPFARGTDEYYSELSFYLNRFDFLSCRENNGVDFANQYLKLKKKTEWCIDPVFLCNKRNYEKLVSTVRKSRNYDYIGAYVIIPRPSINNLLKRTEEYFNRIPVELVVDEDAVNKSQVLKYPCTGAFPIENTLEMIHNCKYLITDSFHGVCFAIIFKKNFLTIPRDFTDRFMSLLSRLGLDGRVLSSDLMDLSDDLFTPIDYDEVYRKLERETEYSLSFLKNALNEVKRDNEITDNDTIMNEIQKEDEQISILKKIIADYEEQLKEMNSKVDILEKKYYELKSIVNV